MNAAAGGCLDEDEVAAFLDGALDEHERSRVEAHTSSCAHCRELLSAAAGALTQTQAVSDSPADVPARRGERTFAPGDAVAGRYRVERFLSRGGMGEVYQVLDGQLGERVALKTVHALRSGESERAGELRREVLLSRKVTHPNVCRIFDFGVHPGDPPVAFLTMELLEGETLAAKLAREGKLSPAQALPLVRQLAAGLSAAHAAGVVHRDFKPQNVIVVDGAGGPRAVITDFGLAAALDTGHGEGVGTPHYMAPEQVVGAKVTAAADVYAFGVVLFELVTGTRPFDGEGPLEIARARLTQDAPLARSRAPELDDRWTQTIARCLAREPAERFASVKEVLDALSPPQKTRLVALASAAAILVVGASALGLLSWQRTHRCDRAARELEGVWDDAARSSIEKAFSGTNVPYAKSAFRAVAVALDDYAGHWITMRYEVCEATRVRGEQSPGLMDLRMSCMNQRREELRGVVRLLQTADADGVTRGAAAVGALSDVSACAETGALLERQPPPADREKRRALTELGGELARLKARIDGEQLKDALPQARGLVERARALGHAPTTALALWLRGRIELQMADGATAEKTLNEALWEADAGRDEDVRFGASLALLGAVAPGKRQADAARLENEARALWRRLGGSETREAQMLIAFTRAEVAMGQFVAANQHAERAVLLRKREPVDGLKLAEALAAQGSALSNLGEHASSAAILKEALATAERVLGADHPTLWSHLNLLSIELNMLGHPDEAQEVARRTLALAERSIGPASMAAARSHNTLGQALRIGNKFAEAEAEYRRSIQILTELEGADGVDVGRILINLGQAVLWLERLDEARQIGERSVAILRKRLGPADPLLGTALDALARIEINLDRPRDAVVHLDEAVTIMAAAHDQGHLRSALHAKGAALSTLKRDAEAVPVLERALAMFAEDPMPVEQSYVEFDLGQALWDSGGDRRRARRLVQTARGRHPRVKLLPDVVAEMDAWLRKHAER
jgi:tetratricopeptide (TPR) repeat protein